MRPPDRMVGPEGLLPHPEACMPKYHGRPVTRTGNGTGVVTPRIGRRRDGDPARWEEQDSNLRRHSQRVYSPPPLATRASPRDGGAILAAGPSYLVACTRWVTRCVRPPALAVATIV